MNELKIHHLVPYAPYNLYLGFKCNSGMHEELIGFYGSALITEKGYFQLSQIRPILYPLNSLNKEVLINGKKITPIIELEDELKHRDGNDYILEYVGELANHNYWFKLNSELIDVMALPYWMVERLFEWNFDVFGLIDSGLALTKV